jgi:hypothetical protein
MKDKLRSLAPLLLTLVALASMAQLNRVSWSQIVGNPVVPIRAPDGTTSLPSLTFANNTNMGFYRQTANVMSMSIAGSDYIDYTGTQIRLAANVALGWNASTDNAAGSVQDTVLTRTSTGILKLSNGTATATAELQVSGGNGGFLSPVKALTELTTIAAAPTTTTAIQLPATSVVLGVSVRVVTVIPTAATFTVTSATPTKTWNTVAVPVAATTTDPGTLPGPTFQTTASAVTITPNLTPGAATGQVRVTIYYYTITPPTS